MNTKQTKMKLHSIRLLYLLISLLSLASCSKEIGSYSDEPRVYFFERATDLQKTRITSRSFSFLISPSSVVTDTMLVRVKIMGDASTHDRIVRGRTILMGTTATEGVHYEFRERKMEADSIY